MTYPLVCVCSSRKPVANTLYVIDTYCDDLREEVQYMIERLPEGGHGAFGYDDGEGDD